MSTSSLLAYVCNDVQQIVYRILHRAYLTECFQEINNKLSWNETYCAFQCPETMKPRANWRSPYSLSTRSNQRIYRILDNSYPIDTPVLPKNYYYSTDEKNAFFRHDGTWWKR